MRVFEKRLTREAGALRPLLSLAVGLGVMGALLLLAQSAALTGVIGRVFLTRAALPRVVGLLLLLAAAVMGRALLLFTADITAARMSSRARGRLRTRLVGQLFALGPAYTRRARTGDLANTVVAGVESLDDYFAGYLPQAALAVAVPALLLVVIFALDPLSGVALLLTAPIIPIFMILIGSLTQRLTQQRWDTLSWMSAHFLDALQGLTTLKLFGRSRAQIESVARVSEQFRRATMRVLRVAFLSSLVMELTATLSVAVVAVEIGVRLLNGGITFERAFFVLVLAPEFYLPLRSLGARHHAAMSAKAVSGAVARVLDAPALTPVAAGRPDHDDSPAHAAFQGEQSPPSSFRSLTFDHVTFTYPGGGQPALRDVSFTLRAGERIALVGPSGAGKSTLASLLLRFMEPDSGHILVDGAALSGMPPYAWRERIAWVPQAPYLFNASAAENIRLARPSATMDDVMRAAALAHAHEFIMSLPRGYDTPLGERGARLSGGQAQRIALARAVLREDAPLLLLDEPSAHLDPELEALLQDTLDRLSRDRTTLVIAHRLATVARADSALVLRSGRLVEQGPPASMLPRLAADEDLLGAAEEEGA